MSKLTSFLFIIFGSLNALVAVFLARAFDAVNLPVETLGSYGIIYLIFCFYGVAAFCGYKAIKVA